MDFQRAMPCATIDVILSGFVVLDYEVKGGSVRWEWEYTVGVQHAKIPRSKIHIREAKVTLMILRPKGCVSPHLLELVLKACLTSSSSASCSAVRDNMT